MLIPIGHEETTVRRLPWVTFAIMGLCLVVFLFTVPGERSRQEQASGHLKEAWDYFVEHPYLVMNERLRAALAEQFGEEETQAILAMMRQSGPKPPQDIEQLRREQERFEVMIESYYNAIDKPPFRGLGVVPAHLHVLNLITYQFVHAGWGHLFGNLFILFLAGPFIEDRWGRPLYTAFYVTAGVFAALMYVVRYPDLGVSLVGASGAIAGLMGAFLIRFWDTKIKFFYWFLKFGTFQAPAWLMLPMWFFIQLASAHAGDTSAPGEGGGGVAFWAHVWGFVFGVIVASTMAYFRIEDRFIHRAIESKITLVENTAVEDAAALAESGDRDGAREALVRELTNHPDDVDAAIALWNLSFQDGNVAPAMPHMLRAIRDAAKRGDDQFVTTHWLEVIDSGRDVDLEPALGARIVEILRNASLLDAALSTLNLTADRVDASTPSGVVLRLARTAVDLGSSQAADLAAVALGHHDLPAEAREELEPIAAAATSSGSDEGEEREQVEADEPVIHTVLAKRVVPRRLSGTDLEVELEEQTRSVDLKSVQVIAVCGITRAAQKPVVLVDLLLDSPWGDRERLRVIRMTSETFDPRGLVGGDDGMSAFQTFLDRLFVVSDAVPLPDPEAARGRPFKSFPTIDDYQREVLGIGHQRPSTQE
jgi:membrane associated rhomboid family serine protease